MYNGYSVEQIEEDQDDKKKELIETLREYMKMGSLDGKIERQSLRKKMEKLLEQII